MSGLLIVLEKEWELLVDAHDGLSQLISRNSEGISQNVDSKALAPEILSKSGWGQE